MAGICSVSHIPASCSIVATIREPLYKVKEHTEVLFGLNKEVGRMKMMVNMHPCPNLTLQVKLLRRVI